MMEPEGGGTMTEGEEVGSGTGRNFMPVLFFNKGNLL